MPEVVRAPDVHFVRSDRLPRGRMPAAFFEGPPDLAVEVLSPEDNRRELAEKLADYAAAGTPRVWVVRPDERTVTVHRLDAPPVTLHDGDSLNSNDAGFSAAGFLLPVADVFPSQA